MLSSRLVVFQAPQASDLETTCDFFFRFFFFFQSDRSTQYQETHSTLNEKKKGDGLSGKKTFLKINILEKGLFV